MNLCPSLPRVPESFRAVIRAVHVVLGSLVSPEAAQKMDGLIADATGKGAKLAAGGARTGSVVEATVLDGVRAGMRVYDEEASAQ